MKSTITFICVVVTLFCSAQGARAQDANLEKAMGSVFNGPEAKGLKVRGHKFNVKKATFTRSGDTVTVKGQISHCLRWRPDDQVFYTIVKKGDKVLTMDVKIERGGLRKLFGWGLKAYNLITGKDIGPKDYDSWLERVDGTLGKGWEDSAAFIICNVGMRTNTAGQDGVRLFRARPRGGSSPRPNTGPTPRPRGPLGGKVLRPGLPGGDGVRRMEDLVIN